MKPRVKYIPGSLRYPLVVGNYQALRPIDHPSMRVSNKEYVLTTPVEKIHDLEAGIFETKNTYYYPNDSQPAVEGPNKSD